MSGGRGRGRGAYKPPTGAQLLMQRTAQESGLDERNLRSLQDLTKPPLYPDFLWHSTGRPFRPEDETDIVTVTKLTQSMVYLIRKSRDIHHRMQRSTFYLRSSSQEIDIARYSKKPRQQTEACDKVVIEHLGKIASGRFLPDELLQPSIRAAAARAELQKRNVLLDDAIETKGEPGESEEEEENVEEIEDPEEDEEDVEDYTTNYYASEDESDGGGDNEPTF
jgi:hypothetical protein